MIELSRLGSKISKAEHTHEEILRDSEDCDR